ncbi:MAG: aryl-sulfate sulfotransferase [Micavibrio aeruginosavorus]|uniref:Aryl-sulfate sulfotransferase n=1 Tax=Micavibrio aeruginosavorus TaxID=349221 RepID=A0A2W5HF05_9BACT|nr:MAG: aryl-sulfate sulfotransferase [Micavibrio aeruginosavorus]
MNELETVLSAKVVKRSVSIAGHLTSISLEEPFWSELQNIAKAEKVSLSKLIARIDKSRKTNLSSALRLYVFHHLKTTYQTIPEAP